MDDSRNLAMADELCIGCSLPKVFGWLIRWESNGTIVMRLDPGLRAVLTESELLSDIYGRIEDAVGVPIRHIVFEAERAAAKATIDSMVPSRRSRLMRNRVVMHPASRFLQLVARLAGLADTHTVFYHVYRGSMAKVRNVFDEDIYAAMVVGAFESFEGTLYDHDWMELGGERLLVILPAKEKHDIAARMEPELARHRAGDRTLELCEHCGLPVALNHLRWDIPNAVITDRRSGTRMSFVDGYAFSAVFRELIAELGDEIVPIIVEASREYTLRRLEETGFLGRELGREASYREFIELLPVYGQGNPRKWEIAGDALEVVIENPHSPHLLAGQLLAIYESVEGRRGSASIEDIAYQRVGITVTPAGD